MKEVNNEKAVSDSCGGGRALVVLGHIYITPVENHSILTSRRTKSSINDSRKTTKDLFACHFKEKFKDKDNSGNCVWNN